ncbi:MAG TPA: VIT domain-containing protein [Kofleriaceae bacterium]|nr:VIT domain-containing protein [Kofleriaceae bacterium]
MTVRAWLGSICALLFLYAAPGFAAGTPGKTTEGRLATRHDGKIVDVPLEHTEVAVRIEGPLAETTVTQRFRNPYTTKIEAVYLFPLPTGAAVNDLSITSGTTRIHGTIQERAKAQQIYTAARKQGLVAALLTQERANLFTQQVANLEPGAVIEVQLRYVQRLDYEDGGYTLVFPMVAPPRYLPAQVKDQAATVNAPTLPPGLRSSHDIGLAVELDAGVAIQNITSTSHQIVVDHQAPARARVRIAAGDTIPNKDFILHYQVAGPAPQFGLVAHRDAGTGSFLLLAEPPAGAVPAQIAPREIVFVLDTSSSMRGAPLAKAKELIRQTLWSLRPDDTFQIVRFADKASALGPGPIASKPENVELALGWLAKLEAGGTTEILTGLETALAVPHDPLRLRIVAFVTDGYVGNEDEILARVGKHVGTTRLFAFGVGSAVNRYLLEEMATIGRGAVQVVRPDEDTTSTVARFVKRIDAPVLTDVAIDWGKLPVADVTPAAIPDLFVGQPLVLAGHYRAGASGTITIRGKQGTRDVRFEVPVTLPERDIARPAVATVWARARIAELSRKLLRRADPAAEREILALSLQHRVLTQYTAFVAVDESRVTAGGEAKRVAVPVEVPDAARAIQSGGSYGYGSIGVGSYGTIGHGSGIGYGYGVGGGGGSLQGRAVAAPTVVIAQPMVVGSLDSSMIKRYVKRQINQVRYCYEKQLLQQPGLAGTVTVTFVIQPTGSVSTATATGLDKEVAQCVAEVVKRIEFPKVESSDGIIQVNYPFTFKPAGAP